MVTAQPAVAVVLVASAVAAGAAALVALAEWLHARRVRRVERLAFGPLGPARWARAAPALRVAAAGLSAWGAVALLLHTSERTSTRPTREASQHLLVALDVSPSMQVADAGPRDVTTLPSEAASSPPRPGDRRAGRDRLKRAVWAGTLVQAIIDRLDTETTRITVIAFYTEALPILIETFEKEVVANMLDGLPMYVGFEGGGTEVAKGIEKAYEVARPWPERSATLVIVSDGDSTNAPLPSRRPDSIADVIVIGVGDPKSPTTVGGHRSRQDTESLKRIAAQLGGTFHEGNERQLPSAVLAGLSMITPRGTDAIGIREAGLIAVAVGSAILALVGPALLLFGVRRSYRLERRGSPAAGAHGGSRARPRDDNSALERTATASGSAS